MSKLCHIHEGRNVLFPVGAIHGGELAVLALTSRRQEERCALGESNGGLIDSQPSGINRGSSLDIIKR